MALSHKLQVRLTIISVTIFIAVFIYNISRDPRSLHEDGDNPRKKLIEQKRRRIASIKEDKSNSLLKLELLKNSAENYDSETSRNIFVYGIVAKPEKQVNTEEVKVPEAEIVEKPVIEQKPEIEYPFEYIGFARTENRNLAVLLDKRTSKMFVAYEGLNLGSDYQVKSIEKKIVKIYVAPKKEIIELIRME